ncbi:MAG: ankyrin repeat domain-containing protein [Aggregatilineales bacterium]
MANALNDEIITLKEAILKGEVDHLSTLIGAQPDLVNKTIRWGDKDQIETELLYFVVGLPFHDMLKRAQAVGVLHLLIQHVRDVNRRNTNGETALHGAVSYGEVEMSRMLINAGADIEATGGVIESGNPLLLAVFFGMLDCAHLLIDHGARVADIAVSAGLGAGDTLKERLTRSSPDASELQRAFAFACINGQQETATILLQQGVDINAIAYRDLTGLHWTAYRNQPEIAEFLLQQGADPTLTDPNYNSTPLGWAIHHSQSDVQQVLENYHLKDKP